MTSLCIMSIFEAANFVAYGNRKHLKLCFTCVNYDSSLGVRTFVRSILCGLLLIFFKNYYAL